MSRVALSTLKSSDFQVKSTVVRGVKDCRYIMFMLYGVRSISTPDDESSYIFN